jgi:hypothetical protein
MLYPQLNLFFDRFGNDRPGVQIQEKQQQSDQFHNGYPIKKAILCQSP